MPIDRCVCFDVKLEQMLAYTRAHHCGLEGLHEHFGCGGACALCVPYIREMLRTGRTSFSPDEHLPPSADYDAGRA